MLVCVSCNVEFKEDKKFCSYCGGPLVTREDIAPNKKGPEKEVEKSEQRLVCPNCKTTYEFGSSCIRCGSGLVAEISSGGNEGSEAGRKEPEDKRESLQAEQLREEQTGTPREDLICLTCKITYQDGNFCPKCGSPLLPQALTQASEEAKATLKPKAGEEPIPLQTIQEELIETPRKNLICPDCKIIYERGNTCVRCGSALMAEVAAQDVGTTESPSTPDHAFDPNTPHQTLTAPVQEPGSKIPSPSSPKRRDRGPVRDGLQRHADQIERNELELFSDAETDKTPGASKQDPATKPGDHLGRRSIHPGSRKIDYRRLVLEVSSILVMVFAGGYLVWSIYFHVAKSPEPKAFRPKEVSAPVHASSSNPLNATARVPVPQDSGKAEAEQRSIISKEKTEAAPSSSSIPSDASALEALEIEKIKDLLEHIRLANLQKDIDLFLSCYATDFKDRDGKKKATLSFWKKFDYLELSYDLKKTSITGDTARVKIEWVIKISPKGARQQQESKTFFDAVLKKEERTWKIQEVKEAG